MPNLYDNKLRKFIREFEGFSPDAYYVPGEDFPTIGIGATYYEDGNRIGPNDRISEEAAQKLLQFHIEQNSGPVSKLPGYKKLPPNAQAAVKSFAFNVGGNFVDDDDNFGTINRAIQAGDVSAVADALPLYINPGSSVEAGLRRRRKAEADLALTPAMDPVDSTLANDLSRKFGTEAVLEGKPVMWGGKDYGWQSPESFNTITPPTPVPIEEQKPSFRNLFGWIK